MGGFFGGEEGIWDLLGLVFSVERQGERQGLQGSHQPSHLHRHGQWNRIALLATWLASLNQKGATAHLRKYFFVASLASSIAMELFQTIISVLIFILQYRKRKPSEMQYSQMLGSQ